MLSCIEARAFLSCSLQSGKYLGILMPKTFILILSSGFEASITCRDLSNELPLPLINMSMQNGRASWHTALLPLVAAQDSTHIETPDLLRPSLAAQR